MAKAKAKAFARQKLTVIRANGDVEEVYEQTLRGQEAQAVWERIKGRFPEEEHPENADEAFEEED